MALRPGTRNGGANARATGPRRPSAAGFAVSQLARLPRLRVTLCGLTAGMAIVAVSSAHGDSPLPPRALLRIGTNDLRTSGSIRAFAFSPDGRFIAAPDLLANDSRVVIWDVRTGGTVKQLVTPGKLQVYIGSLAFSPDGTKLLWGEQGGDFVLWDLPANRLIKCDKPYKEGVNAVAFSPDGSLMAIAGEQVIQLRKAASPWDVVRELDTLPDPRSGDAAYPATSHA